MALVPYRGSTDLLAPFFEDLLRPMAGARLSSLLRAPEADVMENDREIRVTMELAGMKPDAISIDVENNVLTISGEKMEERSEEPDGRYHLTERRYGRFSRSFVLPSEVEPDRIQARFENGVLSVVIPKSERSRARHIQVQDAGGQAQNALGQGQSRPDPAGQEQGTRPGQDQANASGQPH